MSPHTKRLLELAEKNHRNSKSAHRNSTKVSNYVENQTFVAKARSFNNVHKKNFIMNLKRLNKSPAKFQDQRYQELEPYSKNIDALKVFNRVRFI